MQDQVGEILKRARKRMAALRSEVDNGGWREHWNDVATHLLGRRGKYLIGDDYKPNDGSRVNTQMNSSAPEEAVHIAAAGMAGGFTSPSLPWFQIIPEDEDLRDFKPVQEWLWKHQQRMYEMWAQSNWYGTLPQIYEEEIAFGTAAMRMDFHPQRIVHCTQHTIGSYFLASGPDGFVDTVGYRYPRTVRQLIRLYGEKGVSEQTRQRYDKGKGDLEHWVKCVNLVEVNEGRDRKFFDWRGMPYRSITYEEETDETEAPLKMGGMRMFPVLTPRTNRKPEDTYGYSRGMRALADSRQLMKEEKLGSEALAKRLKPPVNIPANMGRADLRVGGQNKSVGIGGGVEAIRLGDFPYAALRDTINGRKGEINHILGASIFQQYRIMDESGVHQLTVPEVGERRSEQMNLLGPFQQSIHTELLYPAIELGWGYMEEAGKLEDPPEEIAEMRLKIQFTSRLALEQISQITNGIQRFTSYVADVKERFPESYVEDNLDLDLNVNEVSQGFILPPKLMREPGMVDEIRQQRAEAMQAQRQAEADAQQAETMQKMSQTPVDEDTVLDETGVV